MPIEILLLGPPQILSDGAATAPKVLRRRERAALFLLATHTTPIARTKLLDFLWGSAPTPPGRTALSATLSRLRKVLPPDTLQRQGDYYLLREHPDIKVDYREFAAIAHHDLPRAEHLPLATPLPTALSDALTRAAALWRGPFLEGCTPPRGSGSAFDNWLAATAAWLEMTYTRILNRLAHHHAAQHNDAEAFTYAQTSLQHQPAQPEILLLALQTLRRQGLADTARDFLEHQRAHLQNTLGEDYPREVLQAARRLIQPPKPAPRLPTATPHSPLMAPFVGRADILSALSRQAAEGGAYLLLGESGQGKTRLLHEFARQIENTHRVLCITCHAGEHALPFAPLLQAFQRHTPDEAWERVPEAWWPYLLHLFPEARRHLPPVVITLPQAPLQRQLMEALRQLLLTMATTSPLVVCVDNAHWSDPATADTLAYWLENEPFAGLPYREAVGFLLIAARREHLHTSPIGKRLIPLLHEQRIPSYELTGLSKAETTALAEAILGRRLTATEGESLWRASIAGTPLYILEILRYQIEAGYADRPVQDWPLSHHIVPLLEQRLRYLTDDARKVLDFIALQRTKISWQMLAAATGLPEERLTPALEMLEETHWVVSEAREGRLMYNLVHAALNSIVTSTLSPLRSQSIHKRLAEAYVTVLGKAAETYAATIAQHYEDGGEPLLAYQWWIRAAHQALRFGIATQAHVAFHRAARIVTLAPHAFTDMDIWRLYAEWTLLAGDTVDVATLENIIKALQMMAEARQSPILRSSLLNAQAHLYQLENRYADALVLSRQALQWLESAPEAPLPRVEIHTHHATLATMQGDLKEALAHLTEAIALLQTIQDPLAMLFSGSIYYQRAVGGVLTFHTHLALAEADRAIETFYASGRVFGVADALGIRSLAHFMAGKIEAALQDCREARERAEQFQKPRMLVYILAYCTFPLVALGRYSEAWAMTEQALAPYTPHENAPGRAIALRARGDLLYFLEDWSGAHYYYTQSRTSGQDSILESDLLLRIGATLAHMGQMDEAQAALRQARDLQEKAIQRVTPLLELAEIHLLTLQGRYDQAMQSAADLLQHTQALGCTEITAFVRFQQATTALHMGEKEEARRAARDTAAWGAAMPYQVLRHGGLEILARLGDLTPEESEELQRLYRHLATFRSPPALGGAMRSLLARRQAEGLFRG